MRFVSRALVVALPVVALAAWVLPVVAQEDTMRQEFEDFKNQIGFGADHAPIDFSERPPLAVPPSNTLPPPGGEASLGVDDPDAMARRKALSDPRRPVPPTDPGASATGLSARTYLVDPPSGLRDPSFVANGLETDRGEVAPKPGHHRHKRTVAQQ